MYDDETGKVVHDFSRPDERLVIAAGGRGGRGNAQFATSTHQAPREFEMGRDEGKSVSSVWSSSYWPMSDWWVIPMWGSRR